MRLAILGLSHETNTFSRVPADYAQFVASGILRGEEIVRAPRHRHQHRGRVPRRRRAGRGSRWCPLVFATTGPCGTITADAFERIADELLGALRRDGPWDGVLLAQHGAAVAEGYPGRRRRARGARARPRGPGDARRHVPGHARQPDPAHGRRAPP